MHPYILTVVRSPEKTMILARVTAQGMTMPWPFARCAADLPSPVVQ
jgi:hypothetical protein